jgi:hypothetical protein
VIFTHTSGVFFYPFHNEEKKLILESVHCIINQVNKAMKDLHNFEKNYACFYSKESKQ